MRKAWQVVVVSMLAVVASTFVIRSGARAQTPDEQEFVFDDPETVVGTHADPRGEILDVPPMYCRRSTLIRIRASFMPEMFASANSF